MESYEEAYLEAVIDNLAASIANAMRDGTAADDLVESEDRLTDSGRLWVDGFLTGRLTMLRSGAVGNPNLSESDRRRVSALVERRESAVAAELYS